MPFAGARQQLLLHNKLKVINKSNFKCIYKLFPVHGYATPYVWTQWE
jgi:hypothetical protein